MVPQPHPLPSPSSRAAVGCKVLCAELCLLWHHCHRDDADKSPCTRAAGAGIGPQHQLVGEKGQKDLQPKGLDSCCIS